MTSRETWTTVDGFSRSILSDKQNYSREEEGNLPHKHQRPAIKAPCTRWDCFAHRHSTRNASAWLPLASRVMSRWSEGPEKAKERWLKVNWIEWILSISVRYTRQESSHAGKWTYLTGTCKAPVIESLFQIPASICPATPITSREHRTEHYTFDVGQRHEKMEPFYLFLSNKHLKWC